MIQKVREDRVRIVHLEKAKKEYTDLQGQLTDLMKKRKHGVMVPIGTKAFMPGLVTHTNQVTVAVGDDYFIKCTIPHGLEIVQRRLERMLIILNFYV